MLRSERVQLTFKSDYYPIIYVNYVIIGSHFRYLRDFISSDFMAINNLFSTRITKNGIFLIQ